MIFKYDHLYSFSYNDPKTKNLPVWDRKPLVFVLDIKRKSMLAINLHWVPKKKREELLNDIIKVIDKSKSNREAARLTYGLILSPKYRSGLKGIRRYILSRATNLTSISRKDWPRVLAMKKYKKEIMVSDEVMQLALTKLMK